MKAHPPHTPNKIGTERDEKGRFGPGNRGRPPGIPTRKIQEIKDISAKILLGDDPQKYIKNVARRIQAGTAPHMETFFAQHLWGKPREHISISLTEVHLLAVRSMSDLELSAFLSALDQQKPEEALRLLPGSAA